MTSASVLSSQRVRRLSKEGFWVVFGHALAVLGSVIGLRLLTSLLTPAAYGELALGMTAATLVNQTVLGPLGNGATRFYAPAQEQGDLGNYLNSLRQLVLWATAMVVFMILLAVAGLLITRHTNLVTLAIAALILALLSGYNSILNGIQNAARQRSIVALHQGIESWAQFLVAAGLLMWLGSSSTVAMTGYAMAAPAVLVSQYLFLRKIGPHKPTMAGKENIWREHIWRYSWPMALTGILSWGFFASQRWALELFSSTEDVGYFSVVFQLGFAPFSLAGSILMTLMMPIFFGRAGTGVDRQKVNLVSQSIIKFCFVASLIVLLATAMGATFHGMIFRLLVAERYRVASHYLPYAILAGGIFQISLFLTTIVLVGTNTRSLLPLSTIGNVLMIAMTFLFTRFYAMDGLFIAMVSGSIIHLVWMMCITRKVMAQDSNNQSHC